MRRFIYGIIGTVLLIASCTTVEQEEHSGLCSDAVIASIHPETRTHIGAKDGNAYKTDWNKGDRIKISTGISSKDQAVYITSDHGTSIASFFPEEAGKSIDFSLKAIAGYPADNMYLGAADPDKEVYFTIPEIQSYVPDSFDSGTMPMISEVTDKAELQFHNAAAVLRLMLSTDLPDIKVSSISVTTSGIISGECGYIPKSRKIFFDDSMLGSNEVTLECKDGESISAEARAFHIVVPHQTYKDMIIRVTTSDGLQQTFTMKSGKEINVGRSSIVTIPLKLDSISDATQPKIGVKVTSVTFDKIKVEIKMENVTSYYCGIQTKLSFGNDMESGNLLESLPYMTPYTSPLSYSGSISAFQSDFSDFLIEPGQSYVIWFVPFKKEGNYTLDDMVYVETMTKSFTSGGSKTVSYSDLKIDMTSISMTLKSSGASYIYCQLLSDEQLSGYTSESEIIKELLKPGGTSTVYDRSSDTFVRKFLKPGTAMTLVALAIDSGGRYGPLFSERFQTDPIPYNSIKVNIDKDPAKVQKDLSITWTASEGDIVEYRYILRDTANYLWQNTLEGSVVTAQEKMYLDPGLYYISHTIAPEAPLIDLISGKEYIIVVVAADSEGNISVADSWEFTY